jgi:hypothetical protein
MAACVMICRWSAPSVACVLVRHAPRPHGNGAYTQCMYSLGNTVQNPPSRGYGYYVVLLPAILGTLSAASDEKGLARQ